jgi:hypothetical protein
MRRRRRAAGDRRDQGELVAGAQWLVARRVLAIDGEHERQVAREVVDRRERVGDHRALGQLELECVAPRALAQGREEADVNDHE